MGTLSTILPLRWLLHPLWQTHMKYYEIIIYSIRIVVDEVFNMLYAIVLRGAPDSTWR